MNNGRQIMVKFGVLIAMLALGSTAFAADPTSGARIYIDEMTSTMEGFIAAEVDKQEVPITITRNEETADFILVGASQVAKRGWKRAVFGGEPDTGSARLYERESGDLVWSSSTGGRSYLRGDFKSKKRIAKNLIKDLNKSFFKGK